MRLVSVFPEDITKDSALRLPSSSSQQDSPTLDSTDPLISVESAPTLLETSCLLFDLNHVLVILCVLSAVHTYVGARVRAKVRSSDEEEKRQLGKLT